MGIFDFFKCKYNKKNVQETETERYEKLLDKYFNGHGIGMSQEEIKDVNDYIQEVMVLNDPQEINSFTTLVLTYLTIAKRKYSETKQEINEKLNNNEVISKLEAMIVAKTVIVNRPQIEQSININGVKATKVLSFPKVYSVSFDPEISQNINSTKYEEESEQNMAKIDEAIRRFKSVDRLSFKINDSSIL